MYYWGESHYDDQRRNRQRDIIWLYEETGYCKKTIIVTKIIIVKKIINIKKITLGHNLPSISRTIRGTKEGTLKGGDLPYFWRHKFPSYCGNLDIVLNDQNRFFPHQAGSDHF